MWDSFSEILCQFPSHWFVYSATTALTIFEKYSCLSESVVWMLQRWPQLSVRACLCRIKLIIQFFQVLKIWFESITSRYNVLFYIGLKKVAAAFIFHTFTTLGILRRLDTLWGQQGAGRLRADDYLVCDGCSLTYLEVIPFPIWLYLHFPSFLRCENRSAAQNRKSTLYWGVLR